MIREAYLKYFVLVVVVCWLSITGWSHSSVVAQDSPKNFKTYLNGNITKLLDRYSVPGISIALIRSGELVWSSAYGYANIKQKKEMTADAICRTESISKSVTAWGVMKLVEKNLIDLDAPAQNYLNDFEWPESRYRWKESPSEDC
jgi:CubicO group peptidase (beta-lactamase class C family)